MIKLLLLGKCEKIQNEEIDACPQMNQNLTKKLKIKIDVC